MLLILQLFFGLGCCTMRAQSVASKNTRNPCVVSVLLFMQVGVLNTRREEGFCSKRTLFLIVGNFNWMEGPMRRRFCSTSFLRAQGHKGKCSTLILCTLIYCSTRLACFDFDIYLFIYLFFRVN